MRVSSRALPYTSLPIKRQMDKNDDNFDDKSLRTLSA